MSRRILVFEENQISWRCLAENWTESQILEHPRRIRWKAGLIDRTKPVYGRRLLRTGGLEIYFNTVEAYTTRHLTYEQDVLNAFAGLAKGHATAMNPPMFQGLPESFFDMSLLWFRREGPLVRRGYSSTALQDTNQYRDGSPFSSWSWAGWKGSIKCVNYGMPDIKRHLKEERVRSVIRWYRLGRARADMTSLLDVSTAIPVLPTDAFVRIQQAHEDPRNDHQVPEDAMAPLSRENEYRYMRHLPGQNQAVSNSGYSKTTEDYISGFIDVELSVGILAAHDHLERYGWRSRGEKLLVHRGRNFAISVDGEGKVWVEKPSDHDLREPTAKMLEFQTVVADEYLLGSELAQFRVLQTDHCDIEVLQAMATRRDFRYLYFFSSCAFFRVGSYEESTELGQRFNILHWDGMTVDWVQIHSDDKTLQTDPRVHEFVIISEAQKYGKKELDSALYEGERLDRHWCHFRLWNILLVEWKDGVAYRIGIGRVWKYAWRAGQHILKFVTLG